MNQNLRCGLIGYSGFVGSNLARDREFSDLYNSRNIQDIRGEKFSSVICAGVSAVKWRANKEPKADLAAIEALISHIDTITADEFILISTIDVYGAKNGPTEAGLSDNVSPDAYGGHRFHLEQWVRRRFPHASVVRLPGLFGPGLKKNIIYDLLHDNMIDQINPADQLQWYPVVRLADDLDAIRRSGISQINISPAPVTNRRLIDTCFPHKSVADKGPGKVAYDVRTAHADVLGGQGSYHFQPDEVLRDLAGYVAGVRR